MNRPTVGRIVHFHPDTVRVNAAIITQVGDSGTVVNLTVFDEFGACQGRTAVQHEDEVGNPSWNYWSWPPRVDA